MSWKGKVERSYEKDCLLECSMKFPHLHKTLGKHAPCRNDALSRY